MKRIIFDERNRSGNLLHIEVPGLIVNIEIGLRDKNGEPVTRVTLHCDSYAGDTWRITDDDGSLIKYLSIAVNKQKEDQNVPTATADRVLQSEQPGSIDAGNDPEGHAGQ